MRNNSLKTVIYDCDGVIFDSFEANFAFYSKVLDHFGKPALDRSDRYTMHVLHTYASRDVVASLFEGDERLAEAVEFASTIDYRDLLPYMHMEEGFVDTLRELGKRFHLAVCTNRSTSVETVLDHFGLSGYFDCVMTAAKVRNPKPHPEPLLKILDFYGILPEEALFVGDSELDLRASESAGVPFVSYKVEMPSVPRIDRHQEILRVIEARETGSRQC